MVVDNVIEIKGEFALSMETEKEWDQKESGEKIGRHEGQISEWDPLDITELSQYEEVHEGKQPLSCEICGKTFTKQEHLNEHMSDITNQCGKFFSNEDFAISIKLDQRKKNRLKSRLPQVCYSTFTIIS